MNWLDWIRGWLALAVRWFEAHPGTASWLEAVGSITAIVFVYLFALFQGRRARSHEDIDRIRRAQGLALVLVPVLTGLNRKSKRPSSERANSDHRTKSCICWISSMF